MLDNFVIPDLLPAAPEIFVVCAAMALVFIDLAFGQTRRWVAGLFTVATLIGAALITVATATEQTTLTFSNLFVDDKLSDFLKLMTYFAVVVVIIYGRGYLAERGLDKGEYYLLVLFATLGMVIMISAASFVTLYLGLELLSLSLYALVAIDRDSVRSTEAAMKYFVLGSMASGLLLYGMSMIYGATGTLEINAVAQAVNHVQAPKAILVFGLVFTVAGIAFKLGLAPFHMWIPDVYHGAPTPITLLIASAPKFAAFALTIRLLVYALLGLAIEWQKMLLIMAIVSIGLGNLVAVVQTNLKRMLAYSAISHMGFMVLGLASGITSLPANPYVAVSAYSASLYYMVAYVLMSLGAFGVILLLSRNGHEAESLDDFKGLNQRSPIFAGVMLMLMFSMAGIPFFVGFFAKFSVLLTLIFAGHTVIAVAAVLFSLVGAFYYLRVVKLMYFDEPVDTAPLRGNLDLRIVLVCNGLAVAFLGVFPDAVMVYCHQVMMSLVG